jgi:hypothetical protein
MDFLTPPRMRKDGKTPHAPRSTPTQTAAFHDALIQIVAQSAPCTVRQAYYLATVRGIVEKTEAGYDRVQVALVKLRLDGRVPFSSISDSTRRTLKPTTYDSVADALVATADRYRRAVWSDVGVKIQIWLEKDALSGVVWPITYKFDVPLQVARGFASLTFLKDAAEEIAVSPWQPAHIFHLGDYDPSGRWAGEKIEESLRAFAPDTEIHFERLAVNPDQILNWKLPSRPTKASSHAKKFGDEESVELDAIPPTTLRQLVQEAIEQHLPPGHLKKLKELEECDRENLRTLAYIEDPNTKLDE